MQKQQNQTTTPNEEIQYKYRLPSELKERYKTEGEWIMEGKIVKATAEGRVMLETSSSKNPVKFYLDTEVQPIYSNTQVCASCIIRKTNNFCPYKSCFVRFSNTCSHWTGKNQK